jgi:hypothetical protein
MGLATLRFCRYSRPLTSRIEEALALGFALDDAGLPLTRFGLSEICYK